MDRAVFEDWLRRYFDAWVSNDPIDVAGLFTEDAIYWVGPFREPWVGRDQIVDRWTSGQQEDVRAAFDVVAIDGDTGVAHWNVSARTVGDGVGRNGTGSSRSRSLRTVVAVSTASGSPGGTSREPRKPL